MRLVEAIIDANHRALAGDEKAGLHPADFADSLPVVALTCIDARLNPLIPQVFGIPEEMFIWSRTAGNIISGPLSSTTRSLALACAIKGGKEIMVIGHTDCLVGKVTVMQLLEQLKGLGIERHLLPDNLTEYFTMFASERQNVIRGAEILRQSPIIGPTVPVHGLLVDTDTGKLEWLVNGYEARASLASKWNEVVKSAGQTVDALRNLTDFKIGDAGFTDTKIGEVVAKSGDWIAQQVHKLEMPVAESSAVPPPIAPPPLRIPLPPPIKPHLRLKRTPKK